MSKHKTLPFLAFQASLEFFSNYSLSLHFNRASTPNNSLKLLLLTSPMFPMLLHSVQTVLYSSLTLRGNENHSWIVSSIGFDDATCSLFVASGHPCSVSVLASSLSKHEVFLGGPEHSQIIFSSLTFLSYSLLYLDIYSAFIFVSFIDASSLTGGSGFGIFSCRIQKVTDDFLTYLTLKYMNLIIWK